MEIFITVLITSAVIFAGYRFKMLLEQRKKDKEAMEAEIKRCLDSPHYYFSNYWTMNGVKIMIDLSEEAFNNKFFHMIRPMPWRDCDPKIKL